MISYLVLALLSGSAFALPQSAFDISLGRAVAGDIQALVDDTVNEGDMQAHVSYLPHDVADVKCNLRSTRFASDARWAFCTVGFDVRFEKQVEHRTCTLTYSFSADSLGAGLKRGRDAQFQACLERLGESLP